jgi:hypothetical protein
VGDELKDEHGRIDYRAYLQFASAEDKGRRKILQAFADKQPGVGRIHTITENPALYVADDDLMAIWNIISNIGKVWVTVSMNTVMKAAQLADLGA